MSTRKLSLCFALLFAAGACDQGADNGRERSSKTHEPIPVEFDAIPPLDELGFVDEGTCLSFNLDEEPERVTRRSGRRVRGRERLGEVRTVGQFAIIGFEVTPETIAPLTLAQLRATAIYFSGQTEIEGLDEMPVEQLFEETEDPFFYQILDTVTGRLYSITNIAAGDTPLEIVFEHGSLRPVAVTEDGSLSFCNEELLTR